MSHLDLLSAGFTAIFGRDDTSSSFIDLFRDTYIMGPPPAVQMSLDPSSALASTEVLVNVQPFHDSIGFDAFGITLPKWYTANQFKAAIQKQTGKPMTGLRLVFDGTQLEGSRTLSDYGIGHGSTVAVVFRLRGGGFGPGPSALRLFTDELDCRYDFDFSNLKDDGKTYMRGGFVYRRPYGWKRIAIKVVGKYENDDWLGPNGIRTEQASGEWPVSYHGTDILRANPILKKGFKPGPRALYGEGIYTGPSLEMVERFYAQEFTHEGKSYKIAFQNRVNPDRLQVIPAAQTGAGADYWLSKGGDARPYGVLIREV